MLEYQNGETQEFPTSPILGDDSFPPKNLVPSVDVHSILFMNDLLSPLLQYSPVFLTDTPPLHSRNGPFPYSSGHDDGGPPS
jgi:hypothetical protein